MAVERVLITGAGGFIGSNLVDDQLARGRAVTAFDINLDRIAHQRDNPQCKLVTGDVRDSELMEKTVPGHDIVFHLASAHLEVNEGPSYFEDINVNAVRRLIEICQGSDVQRLVHCSSVGVYGPLEKLPADEETECRPEIPYEITKLAVRLGSHGRLEGNGVSCCFEGPVHLVDRHIKLYCDFLR